MEVSALQQELASLGDGISRDEDCVSACMSMCKEWRMSPKSLVAKIEAFLLNDKTNVEETSSDMINRFRVHLKKSVRDLAKQQGSKSLISSSKSPMISAKRRSNTPQKFGLTSPNTPGKKRVKTERGVASTAATGPASSFVTPKAKRPANGTPRAGSVSASPKQLVFDGGAVISPQRREAQGKVTATFNGGLSDDLPARASSAEVTFVDRKLVAPKARMLVDSFERKSQVLEERLAAVESTLVEKFDVSEVSAINHVSQTESCYAGRIGLETTGKGERLSRDHLVIEGSRTTSDCARARMDLSRATTVRCFPGQVVLAKGISQSRAGDVILVNEVQSDAALPLAPMSDEAKAASMRCVIAHGPYVDSGEDKKKVSYQPLTQLLDKALDDDADVVVLVGPFVDAADPIIRGGSDIGLTYKEVFTQQVMKRIFEHDLVMQGESHIVVVPSTRDIHHTNIFPQERFAPLPDMPSNVHMVSNPSTFDVCGIRFGAVGHDVLWDLNKVSVAKGVSGNRIVGCATHIIEQQSFYPMYPPIEHSIPGVSKLDVGVDYVRADQFAIKEYSPHVLVCPSMLTGFASELHGVVCINPGRLMRSTQGGTYARVTIHPDSPAEIETVAKKEEAVPNSIAKRTKVAIVKF